VYLIKKEVFKELLDQYSDIFLYFRSGRARGLRSLIASRFLRNFERKSRGWSRSFSPPRQGRHAFESPDCPLKRPSWAWPGR